ncbi:hypothetical protein SCLCIDRAFT_1001093 [Scleroderma citrinum Foug A]|uniref:Uncharacterized protein n=1 Tax=Scleroderma citrinum Foug A TaxID=1036808 RepID=A0A0C3EJM7_9AGAM|nr:hypothetical protein SCLCIDRAFT_1001093 [Scleroderma citrinum Foug A]
MASNINQSLNATLKVSVTNRSAAGCLGEQSTGYTAITIRDSLSYLLPALTAFSTPPHASGSDPHVNESIYHSVNSDSTTHSVP